MRNTLLSVADSERGASIDFHMPSRSACRTMREFRRRAAALVDSCPRRFARVGGGDICDSGSGFGLAIFRVGLLPRLL